MTEAAVFLDVSGATPDTSSAAEVASVEATVATFAQNLPVVLIPVRLETRFETVEVPVTGVEVGALGETVPVAGVEVGSLVDALRAVLAPLEELARSSFYTRLEGTVAQKKKQKEQLETPLYADIADALERVRTATEELRVALQQHTVGASDGDAAVVTSLLVAIRDRFGKSATSLGTLRSTFQRERWLGQLKERDEEVEELLGVAERRVLPAIRLARALGARPLTSILRDEGLDRAGRPLRAELSGSHPRVPARVALADGARPPASSGLRTLPLEQARLSDAAEAVELIRATVTGAEVSAAELQEEVLLRAAAAVPVLPGAWKAELLANLDARGGQAALQRLRAAIAAIPSDRPDLDVAVPDRLRDVVFELAPEVRLEHRLQIRIYPEPLAVDTHEDELTETEAAAGAAFWTENRSAGTDESLRLGAWRALCAGRSTRRAAWIAQATQPQDPRPTPGAVAAAALHRDLTVLSKRLGELGRLERGEVAPTPLRDQRRVAAIDKALTALRDGLAAAPRLPAAALTGLADQLQVLIAAVERSAQRDA